MTMELDVPIVMGSQWEYADYESSNIHIYEKEFRDYVVYYVAHGDSPQLLLSNLQHTSGTGTEKLRKYSVACKARRE